MSSSEKTTPRLRPPEFRQLMDIYAENYRQLNLLFDDLLLTQDRMISRVRDELPIYLEVLERHRYTTVARLTYFLEDSVGRVTPDPDARLRIYHDAQLAEATHCYPKSDREPMKGVLASLADVVDHRWKTNRLLDKWLEFLVQQGHSVETLRTATPAEWPVESTPVDIDLARFERKNLVRD